MRNGANPHSSSSSFYIIGTLARNKVRVFHDAWCVTKRGARGMCVGEREVVGKGRGM